jgi:hypothetical protein
MIGGPVNGTVGHMTDEAGGREPLTVRMRQGLPTRIDVDGVRCRFGINSWGRDKASVYFTVLRGEQVQGFRVRQGDRVGVLGREWQVSELSMPEDGPVRVRLDEVPEPTT